MAITDMRPKANTFWVAANIMFDLRTGEKKDILLLVNKVEDATTFSHQDASTYLNFVSSRASDIVWEANPYPPMTAQSAFRDPAERRYVIKGVQLAR